MPPFIRGAYKSGNLWVCKSCFCFYDLKWLSLYSKLWSCQYCFSVICLQDVCIIDILGTSQRHNSFESCLYWNDQTSTMIRIILLRSDEERWFWTYLNLSTIATWQNPNMYLDWIKTSASLRIFGKRNKYSVALELLKTIYCPFRITTLESNIDLHQNNQNNLLLF